jgi:hypothetical protein
MHDIAEGIFAEFHSAVGARLYPPFEDMLTVVVSGRQAKKLDQAFHGALVGVDGLVGDADAHGL